MQREVITPGDGKTFPKSGDELTMHYVGTFEDGTEFDSSRRKNKPFKFRIGLGMVIKGWDVGVMEMSLGEKSKLTIPGDMAYGEDGVTHDGEVVIPPNATLLFEVELLAVNDTKAGGGGGCAVV